MRDYIAEVIQKFTPLSGLDIPPYDNPKSLVDELLKNPGIIVCGEKDKGILLGLIYPHFTNPNFLIAQELGWWVEPRYRKSPLAIKLFLQFENEAKLRGASKVIMVCLHSQNPTEISGIYLRKGYKPLEHSFIKEI